MRRICEREMEKERERKRVSERLSLSGMCLCVYVCVERAKRAARPSIVGL